MPVSLVGQWIVPGELCQPVPFGLVVGALASVGAIVTTIAYVAVAEARAASVTVHVTV